MTGSFVCDSSVQRRALGEQQLGRHGERESEREIGRVDVHPCDYLRSVDSVVVRVPRMAPLEAMRITVLEMSWKHLEL